MTAIRMNWPAPNSAPAKRIRVGQGRRVAGAEERIDGVADSNFGLEEVRQAEKTDGPTQRSRGLSGRRERKMLPGLLSLAPTIEACDALPRPALFRAWSF